MIECTALIKEEFLIDGRWITFNESPIKCMSYNDLKKRQGELDLPHIQRAFANRQKVEINKFIAPGDDEWTVVKRTITWRVNQSLMPT